MIDIIIPAYNAHDLLDNALSSIAYQDISDKINVLIVDDCSVRGYSEFVDFYSKFFSIREIKMEKNGGPGLARQFGIDNSSSPYIMFLDSDDLLADCFSVRNLFNAMETGEYDIVNGTIVAETGKNTFSFYEDSRIWLHGKMYLRKFLLDNNIRFNDTRLDEDNYFNNLVFLLGARECILRKKTAIWKFNVNSLTRSGDGEYKKNPLYGYSSNISMVLDALIDKDADHEKIASLALACLLYIYYYYLINKDFKIIYECRLNIMNIISIYNRFFSDLSLNEMNDTYKSQFFFSCEDMHYSLLLNPDISFKQFLQKVENGDKND